MGRDRAGDAGWCVPCHKGSHTTRKVARRAARRYHPATPLSPYPCPIRADTWHYGNMPPNVKKGKATREVLLQPKQPPKKET